MDIPKRVTTQWLLRLTDDQLLAVCLYFENDGYGSTSQQNTASNRWFKAVRLVQERGLTIPIKYEDIEALAERVGMKVEELRPLED